MEQEETLSAPQPGPAEPNWTDTVPGKAEQAIASAQWGELCDELMGQNKLAEANGHMIKRLVLARLLWETAARDVFKRGPIMAAPKTGVEMHNPWLAVMNKAAQTCAEIEAELTITPRKRAMGAAVKAAKPPRGAGAGAVEL